MLFFYGLCDEENFTMYGSGKWPTSVENFVLSVKTDVVDVDLVLIAWKKHAAFLRFFYKQFFGKLVPMMCLTDCEMCLFPTLPVRGVF